MRSDVDCFYAKGGRVCAESPEGTPFDCSTDLAYRPTDVLPEPNGDLDRWAEELTHYAWALKGTFVATFAVQLLMVSFFLGDTLRRERALAQAARMSRRTAGCSVAEAVARAERLSPPTEGSAEVFFEEA
jgi:hypothetical protein